MLQQPQRQKTGVAKLNALFSGLMAVVTIISMIIAIAIEPLWYKITYLVVMVPATILGGSIRSRRKQKSAKHKLTTIGAFS